MPGLFDISSTFFVTLLNRLGVKPVPPQGFQLINTVQPVSIVDVDVPIQAVTSSQLLDTGFSAGVLANPAINSIEADTGALPAGNYQLTIFMSCYDGGSAAVPSMALQRRNAANSGNIWTHTFYGSATSSGDNQINQVLNLRVTLANNERIRIINTTATGVTGVYNATIFALLT